MEIREYRRSSTVLELTNLELLLLNNALNEVCNGVSDLKDDGEFGSRLGVSRTEARGLLATLGDVVDRANALPE
jgi:hypothetical protein